MKWEPAALMAIVLALGLWIAFGPPSQPRVALRDGAMTQDVRIGHKRGVLEAVRDPKTGEFTFRVLIGDSTAGGEVMSRELAERVLDPEIVAEAMQPRTNWLFRLLNITSWVNVVWVCIGLGGQLAFSGRMVLQWLVSERRRESVITESFWWFSLLGAVLLFAYFVWRQDPVGILGQASGLVIYARNIRLIRKKKRREVRAGELVRLEGEGNGAHIAADPAPEPMLTLGNPAKPGDHTRR
ncbi:MAG: lipid-A-disaccharide synthase N-terminal domain-containing protein [Phycisphaeraceae bacterium]|nr:lipid-A-disaccharide synthase N-terminal domain-containing protein [Phycisphaeraceae bacterium]